MEITIFQRILGIVGRDTTTLGLYLFFGKFTGKGNKNRLIWKSETI